MPSTICTRDILIVREASQIFQYVLESFRDFFQQTTEFPRTFQNIREICKILKFFSNFSRKFQNNEFCKIRFFQNVLKMSSIFLIYTEIFWMFELFPKYSRMFYRNFRWFLDCFRMFQKFWIFKMIYFENALYIFIRFQHFPERCRKFQNFSKIIQSFLERSKSVLKALECCIWMNYTYII